jgi:hypothetical protein
MSFHGGYIAYDEISDGSFYELCRSFWDAFEFEFEVSWLNFLTKTFWTSMSSQNWAIVDQIATRLSQESCFYLLVEVLMVARVGINFTTIFEIIATSADPVGYRCFADQMGNRRFLYHVLFSLLMARYDAAIDGTEMAYKEGTEPSFLSTLNRLRYLRVGGHAPSSPPHKQKKPMTNSKKSKISKKPSMGMMKSSGKGNGPKAPKDKSGKKGMSKKPSLAPFASETDAPVPPVGTPSPIEAPIPVPIAEPTSHPSLAPMVVTEAPVTMSPTEPPVPDNVVFIDLGNILVTYNTSLDQSQVDPAQNLELGQILAAVNLTCDYIQTQAIDPLGALEFACLWFLTDDSSLFPIQLVYTGTAPFYTNTTITASDLDDAIVNAFSAPQVDSLTESLMTELNMTNPFSLTTSISAEKLNGSTNSSR